MKKRLLWSGASITTIVLVVALAYFEPWRAFTQSTVDEAFPVAALAPEATALTAAPSASSSAEPRSAASSEPRSAQSSASSPSPKAPTSSKATSPSKAASPGKATGPASQAAPAKPQAETPAPTSAPRDRELSRGEFVDAEYETNGTARVIELADGRRFLRIEGLSTSDGPDVHVWLSEATAGGSWGKYDDNGYVKLGKLKATNGNQNYEIPAGVDISTMRSAVIWCDRFNVAFGAAPIDLR